MFLLYVYITKWEYQWKWKVTRSKIACSYYTVIYSWVNISNNPCEKRYVKYLVDFGGGKSVVSFRYNNKIPTLNPSIINKPTLLPYNNCVCVLWGGGEVNVCLRPTDFWTLYIRTTRESIYRDVYIITIKKKK